MSLSFSAFSRSLRIESPTHLYVGRVAHAGQVWDNGDSVEFGDPVYSGTVFVGLDTKFTPMYVGWGFAESGQCEFYLFVGRPFN